MSGSSRLETLVSSERLAARGCFRVQETPIFPHHLRVDAQWKCDGICKIQPRGQPFALGEYSRTFPMGIDAYMPQQPIAFRGSIRCNVSSRTRDCTWGSQRGESLHFHGPFVSLTVLAD